MQDGVINDEIRDFLLEDLGNNYETFSELRSDIEKIVVPKLSRFSKNYNFSDKIIAFLYSNLIRFCKTSKVKGIPLSKKFIGNVSGILQNTQCVHYSHVTGNIFGYAHTFCNEKIRENYFRIPVVEHNLFRFDFFLLLKGLRADV